MQKGIRFVPDPKQAKNIPCPAVNVIVPRIFNRSVRDQKDLKQLQSLKWDFYRTNYGDEMEVEITDDIASFVRNSFVDLFQSSGCRMNGDYVGKKRNLFISVNKFEVKLSGKNWYGYVELALKLKDKIVIIRGTDTALNFRGPRTAEIVLENSFKRALYGCGLKDLLR